MYIKRSCNFHPVLILQARAIKKVYDLLDNPRTLLFLYQRKICDITIFSRSLWYKNHGEFVKSQIPIYDMTILILWYHKIDFVVWFCGTIKSILWYHKIITLFIIITPLCLINASPAFKKKRGPMAAKMSSEHYDFVIFAHILSQERQYQLIATFQAGHLLEWIWLFDFDIQNKTCCAILLI